jgi:hypothetical protein
VRVENSVWPSKVSCNAHVTSYMPLSSRWYRSYSIREAHHLLRDNPVHLNITSFGFTKPSESKDPSRRLVHLLRSPGGQWPECTRTPQSWHEVPDNEALRASSRLRKRENPATLPFEGPQLGYSITRSKATLWLATG